MPPFALAYGQKKAVKSAPSGAAIFCGRGQA